MSHTTAPAIAQLLSPIPHHLIDLSHDTGEHAHSIGARVESAFAHQNTIGGVGSRTGAVLRRFSLSVAPRFLWECLTSRTVSPFPIPAASNPPCGFPAVGFPARFLPRFMGLVALGQLSGV